MVFHLHQLPSAEATLGNGSNCSLHRYTWNVIIAWCARYGDSCDGNGDKSSWTSHDELCSSEQALSCLTYPDVVSEVIIHVYITCNSAGDFTCSGDVTFSMMYALMSVCVQLLPTYLI